MTKTELTDGGIAAGAISAPWWVTWLNSGLQEFLIIGGAVLLVLRLISAVQDRRKPHHCPYHCDPEE